MPPPSGISRAAADPARPIMAKQMVLRTRFMSFSRGSEYVADREIGLKRLRVALPRTIGIARVERDREVEADREHRRLEPEAKSRARLHSVIRPAGREIDVVGVQPGAAHVDEKR